MPEGEGGHVVITSRAHADWQALGAQPLGLDVWEREESLEFLAARTGQRDRVAADAVAQALGDLPLALEQAAAYTNKLALDLAGYLQRLQDRAPELFAAGRPHGYGHTVATVWGMAFEQVSGHRVAGDLLGVCACLAPERIPRELLDAWAENAGAGDVTARAASEAIELLLGYALLTAAADQTMGLHRLIAQFVRSNQSTGERERAAASAVTLLDRVLPDRPREHEVWPACQRLLARALSAAQHAGVLNAAPEQTASVLVRVGLYQQARAELMSARQLLERALAIQEAVYGPEHLEVAITLDRLGVVQRQLWQLEAALATQQRALAIKQAVYGPDHAEVACTLTNIGIVQRQLGALEAARVTQQRALAIEEAVYGPEHPEVACTLSSLGSVQQQLGDLEAASTTLQRALAIKDVVYGPEHPEVASTLTSLGSVQQQLGDLEAARATLERALAIFEAVYGPEHPDVACTLTSLGSVQQQRGELEAAHAHTQHAVRIFERFLGPSHAYTQRARAQLVSLGA